MKKALIISPYFIPTNSADSHRIRMSLPYFKQFDWEAEIVTVKSVYSDLVKDSLLIKSIPKDIKVHNVKALSKKWTSRFGLGSIALRSLWFYFTYVSKLLSSQHYDLIYFSTTQYPVCILGPYWKKRFKVPYVIDIQDPWHTDYYNNKPKSERPPKYWFSYRLNKLLEPIALKSVDGLISVNQAYINELKDRYFQIKDIPAATIPFSSSLIDFEIAKINSSSFNSYYNKNDKIKIAYIGAVGTIMKESIIKLLYAFKIFINTSDLFKEKIELYFLGTSYAPNGAGIPSVKPIANELGIGEYVIEVTERLTYYNAIHHILNSDALFIVGSDDSNYIGSKVYNYLMANKQIYSLLHHKSPAIQILKNYDLAVINDLNSTQETINSSFSKFISGLTSDDQINNPPTYDALMMTKDQCALFDKVLSI